MPFETDANHNEIADFGNEEQARGAAHEDHAQWRQPRGGRDRPEGQGLLLGDSA